MKKISRFGNSNIILEKSTYDNRVTSGASALDPRLHEFLKSYKHTPNDEKVETKEQEKKEHEGGKGEKDEKHNSNKLEEKKEKETKKSVLEDYYNKYKRTFLVKSNIFDTYKEKINKPFVPFKTRKVEDGSSFDARVYVPDVGMWSYDDNSDSLGSASRKKMSIGAIRFSYEKRNLYDLGDDLSYDDKKDKKFQHSLFVDLGDLIDNFDRFRIFNEESNDSKPSEAFYDAIEDITKKISEEIKKLSKKNKK